jgi:hypothetical protein
MKSTTERIEFFIKTIKSAKESYDAVYKFDTRLGDFVMELDCFYQYDQIAAAYLRDCIPTENEEIANKYMDGIYELAYNSSCTFVDYKKFEIVDDLVNEMLKEIFIDELYKQN